jgi:hypothetical protein
VEVLQEVMLSEHTRRRCQQAEPRGQKTSKRPRRQDPPHHHGDFVYSMGLRTASWFGSAWPGKPTGCEVSRSCGLGGARCGQ